MTPEEKGSLPIRLEKQFYELQDRIFTDIVRRIKKAGEITSTADYQINQLLLLGNSTEFIEQELKRLLEASYPEIWALYDKVCDWEYVRYKDAYEQINGNFVPLEENEQVQQWSQAIINQTHSEIKNLTQSMGMTVNISGKAVFTPLAEYYQMYLDRACFDIITGAFDYNTVVRRVVKEMTASGIRSIDYGKSGYSNRVPVAVRRAVMTGVGQLSGQINEMVAKDLKTDIYEVTWHAGHRPSHWWGGNVYTHEELKSVCHLGEGDGLCGWNCRHSYMAFVPGCSIRTYTPEELRMLEEKEKQVKQYQGKGYTPYQASQAQRKMETKMRAQRAYVKQLQQGRADENDIIAVKAKYLNTLRQYQQFSKKMGLPEQMERVYIDGLGRVAPGRIRGSRVSNIKKKTAAEFFDVEITKEMDTVLAANIYKSLNRSDVGKEVLDFIKKNGTSVNIYYNRNTVSEMGLEGLYGQCIGNHIYINGLTTQSVQKTVETIIHEATHIRLNIDGDQHAEAVCDYFAELHTKGELTPQDIRNIIESVKERYADREWRLRQ
ncbi:MAG: phage minor capsid protein [Lachnospiraceae bacterium]|nr:phage minor capsid protein [Lachnospiraceae bacterium]